MDTQQAMKFNPFQISELLNVLEKFGIEPNISDAYASAMFSEIMISGARLLDKDQSEAFFNAI